MIKNVIFDMGGVLISYRWKELLMEYTGNDEVATETGLALLDDPKWRDMDKGLISYNELVNYYLNKHPEKSDMIMYFFDHADELQVPRPTLYPLVEKLFDKGYKIFILSNYCNELFNMHTKEVPFLNKVDGLVLSCNIKMIKPEKEIYEYILNTYSLNPDECIFFDDNKQNVEAAISSGIHAVQTVTTEDIENEVSKLLAL